MKSTDNLIDELTKSHTAVKRDFSPFVRTALSIYALSALMIFILNLIRPFSFTVKNTEHGFELVSFFLFLNCMTYFGFKSFVPGERKKISSLLVIVSGVLLLLSVGARLFMGQSFNIVRPNCEFEAIGVSIVTTFIGHLILRKSEFALRSILSKVVFLSMPMIVTLFMHGVCSLQWAHVLMCHLISPLMIPILYLLLLKHKPTTHI